jgi:triosephosphate isomerase
VKKLVVANWKDRLSPQSAEEWLAEFADGYTPTEEVEIILAVPLFLLRQVGSRCADLPGVGIAVQDVSPFPAGGYTGATPAAWLQGMAGYTLVGHQERRRYFHETDRDAANKVSAALAAGLTPLLCTDEQGVRGQLAALETEDLHRVILAYTPPDAVNLEVARQPGTVAEEAQRFARLSGGRPVLYGGGVHAGNVALLAALPELAGIMTAAGCLEADRFLRLLANVRQAPGPASA